MGPGTAYKRSARATALRTRPLSNVCLSAQNCNRGTVRRKESRAVFLIFGVDVIAYPFCVSSLEKDRIIYPTVIIVKKVKSSIAAIIKMMEKKLLHCIIQHKCIINNNIM